MQLNRRNFLKVLSLSVVGGASNWNISKAEAGWFMNDTIKVTIKVQDEAGQAIPFVTVWQFMQYNPAHTSYAALKLTMEDLWRCTTRYQDTFEFALDYGERPVRHLLIPAMGDQHGEIHDVIDYAEMTGKGNDYPRPDPLAFGYTFMKRGYLPGKLEFLLPKKEGRVEASVTLRRDPSQVLDDRPYLQTYDRIRYELSNTHKNTVMTMENHRRLEGLRAELEQAAQQAITAVDNQAAARIYARMRYLPELVMIDGRIAGFSQAEPGSARSEQYLQRAYELDPDNLFVWMKTIFHRQPKNIASAPQAERIKLMISHLAALIAKHGNAVWPTIFSWRAGAYANLGEFNKAKHLFLEAAKIEPKYTDWKKEIEEMKFSMKLKNIPVPADW